MNKQTYITNQINYLLSNNNTTDNTSYTNGSIGNTLSSFMNNLSSKNNIYYSTGINSIDELLSGGLSPQTITVLGGICGVGKTTLALQIAWFISQHYQKDVLFLATEMSEFQLQVKLLSNISAQLVQELNLSMNPLTYDEIRMQENWDKLDDSQTEILIRSFEKMRKNRRLYIKSIVGHTSVDDIKKAIELHKQETGNAPVVFLDYLQNVRAESATANEKQIIDNAIYMLNAIAHDFETPIVALSSLGRSAYEKPSLSSAKGSGEIEYTASNVILLTSAETKQATTSRPSSRGSARTTVNSTKVQATSVKSRFGNSQNSAILNFAGQYNFFTESK